MYLGVMAGWALCPALNLPNAKLRKAGDGGRSRRNQGLTIDIAGHSEVKGPTS